MIAVDVVQVRLTAAVDIPFFTGIASTIIFKTSLEPSLSSVNKKIQIC